MYLFPEHSGGRFLLRDLESWWRRGLKTVIILDDERISAASSWNSYGRYSCTIIESEVVEVIAFCFLIVTGSSGSIWTLERCHGSTTDSIIGYRGTLEEELSGGSLGIGVVYSCST